MLDLINPIFYTKQALLKDISCLSHGNTYLQQSHDLHMGIFLLLSQDLHDYTVEAFQESRVLAIRPLYTY